MGGIDGGLWATPLPFVDFKSRKQSNILHLYWLPSIGISSHHKTAWSINHALRRVGEKARKISWEWSGCCQNNDAPQPRREHELEQVSGNRDETMIFHQNVWVLWNGGCQSLIRKTVLLFEQCGCLNRTGDSWSSFVGHIKTHLNAYAYCDSMPAFLPQEKEVRGVAQRATRRFHKGRQAQSHWNAGFYWDEWLVESWRMRIAYTNL